MLSNIVSCRRPRTPRVAVGLGLMALIVSLFLCFQSRKVTAAPAAFGGFEGFHDGANCSSIFGWAWNTMDPFNPITVDIYSDNVLIATTLANQFRQDLFDAQKGDGNHAFSISTPTSLKDGQTHSIRVKIGGTNIDLGNTPRSINCSGPSYEGFHDFANCNAIGGWAWDVTQPNTPINVDVYVDSSNFVSIIAPANQFRQDLFDLGKGNGVHGFSFATPSFLKDGTPHSLRVRISGTLVDLGNTPKSINCSANPPPLYEGFLDGADCGSIFGWAWDANQPNTPISVDIYGDNMLIAVVLADQFRQDLANVGKGNGNHAFSLATPQSLKNGQPHTITVAIHNTDTPLGNTPKMLTCP